MVFASLATTTTTNMKKITLTVDVDGNAVSRDYTDASSSVFGGEVFALEWGDRVIDMLDTIEKSKEIKF